MTATIVILYLAVGLAFGAILARLNGSEASTVAVFMVILWPILVLSYC